MLLKLIYCGIERDCALFLTVLEFHFLDYTIHDGQPIFSYLGIYLAYLKFLIQHVSLMTVNIGSTGSMAGAFIRIGRDRPYHEPEQ